LEVPGRACMAGLAEGCGVEPGGAHTTATETCKESVTRHTEDYEYDSTNPLKANNEEIKKSPRSGRLADW
jgi:hypothetical protein